MTNESTNIYIYKGRMYDSPPIKHYHTDDVELINGVKHLTIRRKIPMYIHLAIISIFLLPIIKLNYDSMHRESAQVRKHTLRVPSEMYYDSNNHILDIDITNDSSNFETVSFSIQDSTGKSILQLNGIKPGESIGAVPVDYKFKSLPLNCTLIYKTYYKGSVFKDVKLNVLIVDRSIADKDLNRDF